MSYCMAQTILNGLSWKMNFKVYFKTSHPVKIGTSNLDQILKNRINKLV